MPAKIVAFAAFAFFLYGCSHGRSNDATPVLGKEANAIEWLVLRPSGAVVLLAEPCGVQAEYRKARLFSYESGKAAPSVEHDGCYNDKEREPGPEGKIEVLESDGVTLGKQILEVPVGEAFTPKNFFLPLDNDPRNAPPRIEALGVTSATYNGYTDYETIGLTRQICPFDQHWFLARHIPTGNADPYERCWMEKGNTVLVRDIDYSVNPPALSKEEPEVVEKDRFFAAGALGTTPTKYRWSN